MKTPDTTGRPPAGRRLAAVATAAIAALGLSTLTATPAFAADVTHTIAEVQGTGATTPLNGQTVTVDGVVTGYYNAASGYRGLYLQSADSGGATDATPGASDGIFVYFNQLNPQVAIGDLIRVTGTPGEYQGQTQLTATTASAYELLEAGVGLPEATPLSDTVVGDAREAYEGMLVQPTGDYRLASSHELYNFGSLWLSAGGELVKSTETTDAGPAADAIAASNLARRLIVDDGYSIRVDNSQHVGDQPYFTADVVVRNGDRFVPPAHAMVLGYGFDNWRLQPQVPLTDASDASYKPTFETLNPRPAQAATCSSAASTSSTTSRPSAVTRAARATRPSSRSRRRRSSRPSTASARMSWPSKRSRTPRCSASRPTRRSPTSSRASTRPPVTERGITCRHPTLSTRATTT
jgi:5'-nucleotidase